MSISSSFIQLVVGRALVSRVERTDWLSLLCKLDEMPASMAIAIRNAQKYISGKEMADHVTGNYRNIIKGFEIFADWARYSCQPSCEFMQV